ncbi:MAG: helix-turn-helix domain-containing protein [Ferroplasma sp.]
MASDKKSKIQDAAIKLFSEKGYDIATVDEIAKLAGVSKGIVFFYFKSKRELIIETALSSVPLKPISEINKTHFANIAEMLMAFGREFMNIYADADLRKLFLYTISYKNNYIDLNERLKELCFTEFDKMFDRGEAMIGKSIPLSIRRAFFGSLICYIIWWDESDARRNEYLDSLVKKFMII